MTDTATGQTNAITQLPDDPRIGSTLAIRYRIIAPLGEGGMGTVYRAVHEALRRPVAIKFLQQKIHGNREMVARFEREAVTAANLRHPNIADAIDYGTLPDGTLYLVMELVDGVPLRKLIPSGQGLPVERVLRILEQLASALELAHSMGIVHRDLKPENIMVFDRGTACDVVKIIDFGIARINSEIFKAGPTALTAAGAVFGTPQYMAPEQVMGQPADGRADQYAVGIIAFEMLTGAQPFTSDNYGELVMKHVGAPIPRSVERAPHVPAALDAAIYRMMSKLPDERFATVTEAFRAMTSSAEVPPQSLPKNSIPISAHTVVMHATNIPSTTGTNTSSIAFAATVAPGEQLPLPTPHAPAPAAIRADVPSAIIVDATTAAPAPNQAMQGQMDVSLRAQSAATSAQTGSKSPFLMIAVIGSLVVVVCLVIIFFVVFIVRSPDSANDDRESAGDVTSREAKAAGSSRTMATSSKTSTPSSTAGLSSTRLPASNGKYRLLLKDGKYPFCVTSKLKQAYPVRTNDEGVKVCSGTPEGPISIEGLKAYQPSEFQWE